jgi:hypothetical protein
MDGDLQHDPKDIPRIISELNKGYGLVSGFRKVRRDNFLSKILPSVIANKIGKSMFRINVHDLSSTFIIYRREVINRISIFNGAHRFIPLLAEREGFLVGEMIISHRPRKRGRSKYNFRRYPKVIKDAIMLWLVHVFNKRLKTAFCFQEAKFEIKNIA